MVQAEESNTNKSIFERLLVSEQGYYENGDYENAVNN
jgi:hypothetical protein